MSALCVIKSLIHLFIHSYNKLIVSPNLCWARFWIKHSKKLKRLVRKVSQPNTRK